MSLSEILTLLEAHREELHRRFGVKGIAVFGSYARGEERPGSDLDLLVELERPLGWELVDLKAYLEEMLGIPVDLLTTGALRQNPLLREAVEGDLVYV
ncbi:MULTISPECIES: nucleotidyltransferase family protein [Thermus]|uniref:Nucleotidyltransferase n=2 Tax=Thermus TaxID=270 RepID=A0A430UV54_THESC|nr:MULTISPECIES: nucleotidyltransferase family protein [Thermus]RTI12839.1 nucleotidyltransferase [Thermus scotoductus]WCM40616.1 nucleotidyltransferase [Thermus antranikianii]